MAEHVCLWWLAYLFDNPLRRLVHNPRSLWEGLVNDGDSAIDLGCGLGFFTLALARGEF
jgi:tRNA/tmRNA/rRNA uracil-C5-methylase (TrmA/RlmC/RlmD family)